MKWKDKFKKNLLEVLYDPNQLRDKDGKWTSRGLGKKSSLVRDKDITVEVFDNLKHISKGDFVRLFYRSGWEDDRLDIAMGAYLSAQHEGNSCMMMKNKNEIVGISVYSQTSFFPQGYKGSAVGFVKIHDLATKRRGYGAKMIQEICKLIQVDKRGLVLGSTRKAVPFYRKMGMTEYTDYGFMFTPEQVKKFAKKGYQSEK